MPPSIVAVEKTVDMSTATAADDAGIGMCRILTRNPPASSVDVDFKRKTIASICHTGLRLTEFGHCLSF